MPSSDTQAIAARLTAIADQIVAELFVNGFGEQAARLVLTDSDGRSLGGWSEGPVRDRINAALLAHVETLTQQVAARLCDLCRMNPAVVCFGCHELLKQENARLTAEIAEAREACPSVRMQDHFDASLLKLINNEVVRGFKLDSWLADAQKRAEQAEQQRDAALAALTMKADAVIQAVAELPDRTSPDDWPEAMLVTADELRAILADAALAASAPQKEEA